MTNQQYIEEIIKVAIKGNWTHTPFEGATLKLVEVKNSTAHFVTLGSKIEFSAPVYLLLLDPNFFRAIGKACELEGSTYSWQKDDVDKWFTIAFIFYEKNLTQDLDHAIEWLYKLIKE